MEDVIRVVAEVERKKMVEEDVCCNVEEECIIKMCFDEDVVWVFEFVCCEVFKVEF